MNLDDFSTVVEDRRYINPQVGLDESNAFIENLRSTQQANTQEIAQDTYNLGTAVPSNLGGLGGAGSYFTSRYQTPQTNEVVANLRTTAQAQALSEALNNKVAQAKQRYNQAYRAAQKRANANGGTTGGTTGGAGITGDVEFVPSSPDGQRTIEEVDPNSATGSSLDTIITNKEAELRIKKNQFESTKKQTGYDGSGDDSWVNYIFTPVPDWNSRSTQIRRKKEIEKLEREIATLKSKRGY